MKISFILLALLLQFCNPFEKNKKDDKKPLIFAALAVVTAASSSNTASRSTDTITSKYNSYAPTFTATGNGIYEIVPSVTAAYAAGSLKQGFIDDGVKMANFARYLAFLPDDLVSDSALNSNGQYGAVLLSASSFSHTPSKPADMDTTFYNEGYSATSSSNIAAGFSTLHSSIQSGYMRDSDTGNMSLVGHRRWILNPQLKKVGFGFAGSSYSLMKVFDKSRTETFDYSYTAWPAEGFFPTEFFSSTDPWSLTLNPKKYKTPTSSSAKVTLTRSSDGKSWTLSSADSTASSTSEYFTVNTGGYGVSNCIIFRPKTTDITSLENDSYTVNVSGIQDISGNSTTVSYTVKFFKMGIK
ncbi:MAG TPA: CAP domain-containing protein [Leptospiraceae bacterium]|nr:CAP domain-containing protein [Leptospiraceae bacterium]HMY67883.1 CAP domain-containing protein [Leptospiraceae bacterium]HNF13631.1 CAP domain-containing protein [Leptospiraceae bacterium]HNH08411.1 CAP domain-containing protein [Leptospiraceae bacterium]HNI98665.1 CAP domain-containing protein [Leptospiraceae bacterium]